MTIVLIIAAVTAAVTAVHIIRGELVNNAWDQHVNDALEVTR